MQAAINFGGLSANDLLKRKTNILVLMRREMSKESGNGKGRIACLKSIYIRDRSRYMAYQGINLTTISISLVMIVSQLQNAALWFR